MDDYLYLALQLAKVAVLFLGSWAFVYAMMFIAP